MNELDMNEFTKRAKVIELRTADMRHLTTLTSGFLVLISTFIEKVFTQPINKYLVGVTIGFFIISLILFLFGIAASGDDLTASKAHEIYLLFYGSGLLFFMIALCSLALFAISNYYGFIINVQPFKFLPLQQP